MTGWKILITLFVGLIANVRSDAQGVRREYSSHDYYEFYKSILEQDTIIAWDVADLKNYYLDTEPRFEKGLITNLIKDGFIKSGDTTQMFTQLRASKGFKWQPDSIVKGIRTIPGNLINEIFQNSRTDNAWLKYHEKYKEGYGSLSIPLFTTDGNTCVIEKTLFSSTYSGKRESYVYKRDGNRWKLVTRYLSAWTD